ncbi:DUF6990 domain-containing protein [Palleronia caenipelagi]|uniref:DUF4304 domain-containing protein n=1 Tax=Palleronia caenipelagi TaxID=2489174 RepID=A0A547PKU6_9RHOB|nr:hypothetical protein [Palleronia caenipelagi]TRD14767.1 hypothetical protein FEV53_18360 [Palleronia caenipelagi]
MNAKEVAGVFTQLGWTPKRDIDRYAEKETGDRVVRILFTIKDLDDFQKFEGSHSIRTETFTAAVKEIEGGRGEYNDLLKVNFKNKVRFQEPEITRKHIEIACDKAIEWAMSVDIDQRYEELCSLDPATPGAAGVWHLAALALNQHTNKLLTYQKHFETGDRCGFVNFITKDYIDRAVILAEQNEAGL